MKIRKTNKAIVIAFLFYDQKKELYTSLHQPQYVVFTGSVQLERIREYFGTENGNSLDDVVAIDETYIDGKNKNRHNSKKVKNAQGCLLKDKSAVVGMVQRQGKVNAHLAPDTKT